MNGLANKFYERMMPGFKTLGRRRGSLLAIADSLEHRKRQRAAFVAACFKLDSQCFSEFRVTGGAYFNEILVTDFFFHDVRHRGFSLNLNRGEF